MRQLIRRGPLRFGAVRFSRSKYEERIQSVMGESGLTRTELVKLMLEHEKGFRERTQARMKQEHQARANDVPSSASVVSY